jgi:hypothetical protein
MAVRLTKNMTTKLAACTIEAMALLSGGVGPVALFREREQYAWDEFACNLFASPFLQD